MSLSVEAADKLSKDWSRSDWIYFWKAFFLGFGTIYTGVQFSWNYALGSGFYPYFIALVIVTLAFIALTLCMAEMTSILPFSGGSYGFARITIGPFIGYMIGCFESLINIFYVGFGVSTIGTIITYATGGPRDYEPYYWIVVYVAMLITQCWKEWALWSVAALLAVVNILLLVIYCAGSANSMNFEANVTAVDTGFSFFQTPDTAFAAIPIISYVYIGIETMPLMCDKDKNSREVIPRAMVAVIMAVACCAFVVLFSTITQPPGLMGIAAYPFPMDFGFSEAFGIADVAVCALFTGVGQVGTFYGFMYAYGRQMLSMSRSKLYPSIFSYSCTDHESPLISLLSGVVLGYMTIFVIWKWEPLSFLSLFNACCIATYFVYLTQFISYLIFSLRFNNLERRFVNPLGIASAVFGFVVFTLGLVSQFAYSADTYLAVKLFAGFTGVMTVYYFFYAKHVQSFSEEEQSIMLILYVVNANSRAHKRISHFMKHVPLLGTFYGGKRVHAYDHNTLSPRLGNSNSRTSASGANSKEVHHKDMEVEVADANRKVTSVELFQVVSMEEADLTKDRLVRSGTVGYDLKLKPMGHQISSSTFGVGTVAGTLEDLDESELV